VLVALAAPTFADAASFSRGAVKDLLMRHNQRHRGWRLTQATLAAALIYHQLDPAVLLRLYPRARPLRPQAPLQAAVPFFDAAHFSRANEKELLRRHNENHRNWQLARAELTASLLYHGLGPAVLLRLYPRARPLRPQTPLQEFMDFSARERSGTRSHVGMWQWREAVGPAAAKSHWVCTSGMRNTNNNAPSSSGGTMPLSLASTRSNGKRASKPTRTCSGSWGWRSSCAARGGVPRSWHGAGGFAAATWSLSRS
jgi:hypothetical protein